MGLRGIFTKDISKSFYLEEVKRHIQRYKLQHTFGVNSLEFKNAVNSILKTLRCCLFFTLDKPKSVTICETKKTTITCKKGKKMNILHANYGRLNKNTCGKSTVTNCRASTSLGFVQKTCKGKVSCALHASNSVFGDPCRGVRKYLTVKYKCEWALGQLVRKIFPTSLFLLLVKSI